MTILRKLMQRKGTRFPLQLDKGLMHTSEAGFAGADLHGFCRMLPNFKPNVGGQECVVTLIVLGIVDAA
ncbi:hypothetical protein AOL_s00007g79 [Orbilia oligospora ATCC 24927]|uniref:Uncharacterized protein n=2 Tax=Orbilia oligospora TaxID=2813651 RepID=G1X1C0_ARTOA|nr:hypothetical protein AOL_s00007g79 [Orbilia oligospora ATCC 24927]EGX53130.1 hypothetical protein AOL_s00007g79 [Orbilia oligospora ATCC 24927]KAF3287540.1 hypothetical protein TWF970_007261 [Orbilia oligospora]